MCGIAGIIRWKNQRSLNEDIKLMVKNISHRGPDSDGFYLYKNLALGHRRLSIIDLSSGDQPMFDKSGNYCIVYNGEIYNYLKLRYDLEALGYPFTTNSDTEVIINSYIEWGEDCLNKFRGMFSFAILDMKLNNIFLARDHFGIKPFFFVKTKDFFAFASELQAFKSISGFNPEIDINSINLYLQFQYIPSPSTIFKDVQKLVPAHYFKVDLDGKIGKPKEYWNIDFKPDFSKSINEWVEEADSVIKNSVKAHLVSDVPFGAFLSGGIDSSLIVSYMAKLMDEPVKTFSIGFEEQEFNELEYANIVAKKWQTEHYTEIVKPDAIEVLPKLVRHFGEPYGDSSAIPSYYVSKLARNHVPMVLSGDGGDELFAGYQTYQNWINLKSNKYPLWKKMLYPLAQCLYPERFPVRKHNLNSWLSIINYFHDQKRYKLFKNDYLKEFESSNIFNIEYDRSSDLDALSKVQYLDIKTYLHNDILSKVDISTMMHGLESRPPLIDVDVAEFAASIPPSLYYKLNGQINSKFILKEILKQHFPVSFIDRKKMGFGVPIKKWFKSDEQFKFVLNDKILSKSSLLGDYFDMNILKNIIQKVPFQNVWLLLVLEEWLNQFKERSHV